MHKPTNDPLCQTTCYADLPTTTLSTPIDLRAAPQPVSTPLCCNLCVPSVLPRTCMRCVPPLPRTCMHRLLSHTCMHRPAQQPASITHRTEKANAVLSPYALRQTFQHRLPQAQPQSPHPLLGTTIHKQPSVHSTTTFNHNHNFHITSDTTTTDNPPTNKTSSRAPWEILSA
jgi:hypothetical protein